MQQMKKKVEQNIHDYVNCITKRRRISALRIVIIYDIGGFHELFFLSHVVFIRCFLFTKHQIIHTQTKKKTQQWFNCHCITIARNSNELAGGKTEKAYIVIMSSPGNSFCFCHLKSVCCVIRSHRFIWFHDSVEMLRKSLD